MIMQLKLLSYALFLLSLSIKPHATLAAGTNINQHPHTVRPINTASSGKPKRLPFIPSIKSRRAAQKAYLQHLQTELETAQRQLYVSQNTCTTLRKRCEDQRRETLALLARSEGEGSDTILIKDGDQQRLKDQEKQIEKLESQLDAETEKYSSQMEQMRLLQLELKDLTSWKEDQEQQSIEGEQFKEQLKESYQKITEYEQQVELLSLKLEAAELAAKQRKDLQKNGGDGSTWERRAEELRTELASVRSKYVSLVANSEDLSLEEIGEQMDLAIQSAVQSSLEAVEKEWEQRFETINNRLTNVTEERDSALKRLEEALSEASDEKQPGSLLSDEHQRMLKEKLTRELTDELTEQLTEELTTKLTEQLSASLTDEIKERYRKKYAKLLKQQNQLREKEASEHSLMQKDSEEHQREILATEIEKVKEKYELEYKSKLEALQRTSDEQIQVQKERMRKLVRALLEREAKQKREMQKIQAVNAGEDDEILQADDGGKGTEKGSKLKSKAKKKKKKTEDIGKDGNNDDDSYISDEMSAAVSPTLTASRMKRQSRPGIVSKF